MDIVPLLLARYLRATCALLAREAKRWESRLPPILYTNLCEATWPPAFGNGGPGVKWPLPSPKAAPSFSLPCRPRGIASKDRHCFGNASAQALPPIRRALPLITGLSLLPKCPICFAAYAGVLSSGCGASVLPVLRWACPPL